MRYILYHLLLILIVIPFFYRSTPPARFAITSQQASPDSGIQTSGGYSVESLVKNIFAKGACDNISNVRAIGSMDGIGYFENGATSIGMNRGIIIATGPIQHAEGPNKVGDKSGNFDLPEGDPDLSMFSTHRILDAEGIEFDFTPLDSFVRFRYVFASEEYCEFVGSVYNDVFGFFVSGPGIQGPFSRHSKNVALIPGSNAYVSINSVNHVENSNYFIRNELESDSRQCGVPPSNSPYRELIEYDGFTRILTAALQVIPCETYHIRFVVSDVADRHYDSAVFLEAESFNIGGTVQVTAVGNTHNTAVEGCEPAAFVFERGETEFLDRPLSVHFKITNFSTATEGVDFATLPRTITIPAGQKSVKLPVQVFNDGIAESAEKLSIELDIPCACYSGGATMLLTDAPAISVYLPPAYVCRNTTTTLKPQVQGGVPPYTYQWSNGATASSINITSGTVDRYSVTVTDHCGTVAAASAAVTPIEPPTAMLSGDQEICAGDTARLPIQLSGMPPFNITYTINGAVQLPLEIMPTGNAPALIGYLPATEAGLYEITKVEDAGCTGTVSGSAKVEVNAINIRSDIQNVRCNDGTDGAILVDAISGNAPFRYQWAHTAATAAQLANLKAGVYFLTVTDYKGCQDEFKITVAEPTPLQPVTFSCTDLTNPNFQLTAHGGTPPYLYSIDGVHYSDASLFHTLEPGKTYSLTIRDAENCTLQQSLSVPPVYEKMVELPTEVELHLGEKYTFTPQLNIAENLITKVEWLRGEGLSCQDCLTPQVEVVKDDIYTLQVTDIFGCTGEASVQIKINPDVDIYIPTAFSPNGDLHNDFFTIYANEKQVEIVRSLLIFDRWGNQVFAIQNLLPNDERSGWDGNVNGKLPDAGVFVYLAQIQLRDGTEVIRKGHVVLMR